MSFVSRLDGEVPLGLVGTILGSSRNGKPQTTVILVTQFQVDKGAVPIIRLCCDAARLCPPSARAAMRLGKGIRVHTGQRRGVLQWARHAWSLVLRSACDETAGRHHPPRRRGGRLAARGAGAAAWDANRRLPVLGFARRERRIPSGLPQRVERSR